MKKEYFKPIVVIESFNLAQSIAVVCTGYQPGGNDLGFANQRSYTICSFETGNGLDVYFTDTNNDCTTKASDPNAIKYGCYNNVGDASQAFSSI